MADVVIIGGGLNGLVAGALLAKRHKSVLILERRPIAGGAAVTAEIAPGFRAPILSHALGPLDPDVTRALGLDSAGLQIVHSDPALVSIAPGGRTVAFSRDAAATASGLAAVSASDAQRWPAFVQTMDRLGGVLDAINHRPAPDLDRIAPRDWIDLLAIGRTARRLDKRTLAKLTRYVPMAVADLAGEWFETDQIRAAISAHAVFGNLAGPWSAGTGGMLLQRIASDRLPVGSGATTKGGPGAVADAIRQIAERAGAQIRTGAEVTRIQVRDGRVTGLVLGDGIEVAATTVIAAVDPRQTFLKLVDPAHVPPTFLDRMRHYRARGVTAKINLALDTTPAMATSAGTRAPARWLIAPAVDDIERAFDAAKYGDLSPRPWLDIAIPTLHDPSLAPAGKHVMSIVAHFAPRALRQGTWAERRDEIARNAIAVLTECSSGIDRQIAALQIVTPEDLEQQWGLSGGHIFQGEPTIDQLWAARPLLGWARHRSPVAGLFMASAGTHPGGGLTGLPALLAAARVGDATS